MNHADITFANNEFTITGNLDFSNVMRVYQKALPQFNSSSVLVFDFSGLKTSNSAAIALIVEWLRYAKKHHKQINFRNISPALQSIAKAARLDFIA